MAEHHLQFGQRNAADAFVGASAWAQHTRALVADAAACASSVTIIGESGTGKEFIARAIHAASPRAQRRFVPVDCASATASLLGETGYIQAADGGTIFFDEIASLDLDAQASLVRMLEDGVDVRVIAATTVELLREVAAGRFRRDLYGLLSEMEIGTSPLRERPEDIEALSASFLSRFAAENAATAKRLSAGALERLSRCGWPGNVDELQNALERAVVFAKGDTIGAEAFPEEAEQAAPATIRLSARSAQDSRWLTAAEVDCEHIRRTLEHVGYNEMAAARLLDMNLHQLQRRMVQYGLAGSPAKQGRSSLGSTRSRRAA